jgi:hypothetical protein
VLGQGASTAIGEGSDANAGAKGVESPDQMSNPTLLAILNLSVFRSHDIMARTISEKFLSVVVL